ncbi:MAG: hypothetical protein QOJ01_1141 [Solirubrobacterales bacterium]|jgi:hypothetical protein|nr:hypothetical protein [Solirubrobacterales bacterium]
MTATTRIKKVLAATAALGALAVGGAAIAQAGGSGSQAGPVNQPQAQVSGSESGSANDTDNVQSGDQSGPDNQAQGND